MIADRRHGWEPVTTRMVKWGVRWLPTVHLVNEPSAKKAKAFFDSMPQKPKLAVGFRIKRSPKTKQFHCVIVGGNGEPIYTGEPCKNRKDVKDTMENFISAVLELRYVVIDETVPVKKRPYEGKPRSGKWP